MKKYKAVLFGNGYWAKIIKKYFCDFEIELIGIVDINTTENDVENFIFESNIAFVCTPVETHYDIVKRLIQKDIHVFCEKILTKSSQQTNELIKLANYRNVVLFTDYTYLYSEGINNLKKEMINLGDINIIKATISQYGKIYKDVSIVENVGVHMIAVIRYVLNSFEQYNTSINFNSMLNNDTLFYCEKNLKGINIIFDLSLMSNYKMRRLEIIGRNGIISYDMMSKDTVVVNILSEKHTYHFDESNNLMNAIGCFINCIRGDRKKLKINQQITKQVNIDLNHLKICGEKDE